MMWVSASLIKEWRWCPTFAWLSRLGLREPLPPYVLDPEGWDYHEVVQEILTYRASVGDVTDYEVNLRPKLRSRSLGIYGVADMALVNGKEVVVAEVKTTSPWMRREHVDLQVTAYALMAKETYGVEEVISYAISRAEIREVDWVRNVPKLLKVVRAVKHMLLSEEMPKPDHDGPKCRSCPYRRICPYAR